MEMGNRATLLINCSQREARRIRETATRQRRTISGYVLNILMKAIRFDESLTRLREVGGEEKLAVRHLEFYGLGGFSARPSGPRTTMLLSCSKEDAHRIRETAKRKETTMSGLVLHALRLAWAADRGSSHRLKLAFDRADAAANRNLRFGKKLGAAEIIHMRQGQVAPAAAKRCARRHPLRTCGGRSLPCLRQPQHGAECGLGCGSAPIGTKGSSKTRVRKMSSAQSIRR